MTRPSPTVQELFPKFARELKKYPPDFHALRPGATAALIANAEKQLRCKFPDVYRQFLMLFNGGILFGNLTMIFGIHEGARKRKTGEIAVDDLVKSNQKKWPGIPDSYLQIASTGFGDHIALDLQRVTAGDVRVVQWCHEAGGTENSWRKFASWLDHEMAMGRGSYDFNGNVL